MSTIDHEERRRWLSVMAKAPPAEVTAALEAMGARPSYRLLRRPETGLVMIRARAGGDGRRFNLGEMTVTRCSVRLDDGTVGHAYVAGRDPRHAEAAAVLDALLQDGTRRGELMAAVIDPLAAAQEERRAREARRTAATRVDFFTMVRGED